MREFCRIAPNVKMGENVSIHAFVNLYGCSIGDNSRVGAFVEIQKNASIGRNVKVSSHTFVCEGVEIEDDAFIGHNVSFINDKYPRATSDDGSAAVGSGLAGGAHPSYARSFDWHRGHDPVWNYDRRERDCRRGQCGYA